MSPMLMSNESSHVSVHKYKVNHDFSYLKLNLKESDKGFEMTWFWWEDFLVDIEFIQLFSIPSLLLKVHDMSNKQNEL